MNKKNIIGFAFGPITGGVLGLITLPIMTWIFSAEDIARANILQITISFFLLFTVLGLDQTYVREYHETENKSALLKSCVLPGLILLAIICTISVFFSSKISILLFDNSNPIYYIITLIAILITFISRFLSLILRMQDRGLAFSMSQVLPKVLQLVIIIGFGLSSFHKEFIHLQISSIFSLIVILFIYSWNTKNELKSSLRQKVKANEIIKFLQYGFPLIFSGLAFWGINATSTFSLKSSSNLSELAIFSVAMSCASAATIIQSIFSVIWTPTAFKWHANGVDMQRIDLIAQQTLALIVAVFVLSGTFAWIIDILLPQKYSEVKFLMLCCIIQPLLYTLSVVTSIGIGIAKKSLLSLLSSIGALLTNILLCFLLIPKLGASGAAIANSFAFFILFLINTEASAYVWRKFPRTKIYITVIGMVTLATLSVTYGNKLSFHISYAWATLIPLVIIIFKKQWGEIYEYFVKVKPLNTY